MIKAIDILTLLNTPSIGRKTVENILIRYQNYSVSSPNDLLDILEEIKKTSSRVNVPTKEEMNRLYYSSQTLIESSLDNGIKTLDINHPHFPKRLKNIPDAPVLVYVKGNSEALNSNRSVAIIGTREATDFGMKAGERLSSIFTKNDFVIVSGLAVGCDTAGHIGCLKENGISIGVLAGGLDKIYPKESRGLAEEILEKNGCLLSEYPIGVPPRRNFFVERDRLQSGLSQAVIVIETDVKGGTMHTVGFAGKQNRYLACLGGHPEQYSNHPKIQGNKMLIGEGKAKRLGNMEEINNFINLITKDEINHIDIITKPQPQDDDFIKLMDAFINGLIDITTMLSKDKTTIKNLKQFKNSQTKLPF